MMSMQQNIDGQLSRMSGDGGKLCLQAGGGELKCRLAAVDSMSCSFLDMTLHTNRLAGASAERLDQLSETLSQRLSYLLEPVGQVETDNERLVVQMRSKPPKQDAAQTSYYELLLAEGGTIQLRRYSKPRGERRRVVPALLTREVFARLAQDLADAV